MQSDRVQALLDSAKQKMYATRLKRPTPYVDRTVYVNWNALCISAYLEAARVLQLSEAQHFALRSLDRILAEAWKSSGELLHVVAYSDAKAAHREVSGLLDDYAFTANACLDAYESTADLSYFNFARRITDAMVARFFDLEAGGFFDSPTTRVAGNGALGVLDARRKPFQDSPTPAGNSAAVIALLRMHSFTNKQRYWVNAKRTMELFAGVAEQYGIFAGTYGIAAVRFSQPHTQVVIIGNNDDSERLWRIAVSPFAFNKIILKMDESQVTTPNLPPALAETLPSLPGIKQNKSIAVICSGFTCQPPISEPEELTKALREALRSK